MDDESLESCSSDPESFVGTSSIVSPVPESGVSTLPDALDPSDDTDDPLELTLLSALDEEEEDSWSTAMT